ncbi:MAG: hypothetical protein IPM82_27260 [Saprospiraceae bacterium]|nr:hypothetical protein [Saprospiraceae bacterium]
MGAVSTINNGKVWIDENLDAETKTVIAAVATRPAPAAGWKRQRWMHN